MMPSINDENDAIEAWRFLLHEDGSDLMSASETCRPGDVAGISQLRRKWTAIQVSAAIELQEARRRSVGKFEHPESIVADRVGVEQATGTDIARYKARRLHDSGVRRIGDLCCGIGGDAMQFAQLMETTGIDRDPLKAWMTSRNAGCQTICSDVTETRIEADAIHIDPARRDPHSGRRTHAPSDWLPDQTAVKALLDGHPDASVKMGPGIDTRDFPLESPGCELEFISVNGQLKQAMLWTGALAQASRRATRLMGERILSLSSDIPEPAHVEEPRWNDAWLHVPDPSLERARLLGLICRQWNLAEPCEGLGLLIGDAPADTPWLIPYQVVDQIPWRVDRIKEWLRHHDGGKVEIRTRGRALEDVDRLRSDLTGSGSLAWTIFGLRLGDSRVAIMTRPRGHSLPDA